MNPSLGRIDAVPLEIPLPDGTTLAGRAWTASSPRGLIAIVHGLGEHGGRYGAFASDLVDAGFTVAALDWPGHGRSRGQRGDACWTDVRDLAIPALLGALRAAAPRGLPVQLFGHSMGGAMALDYALAHPSTIVSVVATAPGLRAAPPPRWKLAAARVMRVLAPGVGIAHGLPLDGLSRDPEVVALYKSDPLVHGVISARLYFGLAEAQARVLATAVALAVPALVLAGTADTVVDSTGARDFVAAAPAGRARFVACAGAYHEILNDVGRDEVARSIVEWLTRGFAASAASTPARR
jgi:alpha-beta hydrolase superfamily lysophospholipase